MQERQKQNHESTIRIETTNDPLILPNGFIKFHRRALRSDSSFSKLIARQKWVFIGLCSIAKRWAPFKGCLVNNDADNTPLSYAQMAEALGVRRCTLPSDVEVLKRKRMVSVNRDRLYITNFDKYQPDNETEAPEQKRSTSRAKTISQLSENAQGGERKRSAVNVDLSNVEKFTIACNDGEKRQSEKEQLNENAQDRDVRDLRETTNNVDVVVGQDSKQQTADGPGEDELSEEAQATVHEIRKLLGQAGISFTEAKRLALKVVANRGIFDAKDYCHRAILASQHGTHNKLGWLHDCLLHNWPVTQEMMNGTTEHTDKTDPIDKPWEELTAFHAQRAREEA